MVEWLSACEAVLPPPQIHPQPIHITSAVHNGRTVNAFIECVSEEAAQRTIDTLSGTSLCDEQVVIRPSSQAELLFDLWPDLRSLAYKPPAGSVPNIFTSPLLPQHRSTSRGRQNSMPIEASREICFFGEGDRRRLEVLFDSLRDYQHATRQDHLFVRPAERPYGRLISVLTKLPWHLFHDASTGSTDGREATLVQDPREVQCLFDCLLGESLRLVQLHSAGQKLTPAAHLSKAHCATWRPSGA